MIYALADLHLDYSGQKPMGIFGNVWKNHEEKIFTAWNEHITDDDVVLIPGDISWAMKLEDAYHDLIRIDELPGKKILLKGNHDYWWQSISKIEALHFNTLHFLQNRAYIEDGTLITGTRGWSDIDLEGEESEHEKKVFRRELIRLELSLKDLTNESYEFKIAMLHYPPFDKQGKPNEFARILEQFHVDLCVYGHLHAQGHKYIREGKIGTVQYVCASADYLNFRPIQLRR